MPRTRSATLLVRKLFTLAILSAAPLLLGESAHAARVLIGEVADTSSRQVMRKELPSALADVLCDRINERFGRRHACRAQGLSLRGVDLSPHALRQYRLNPDGMQFAVLRSDLQYWAGGSLPESAETQSSDLRALFALESIPVIAFTDGGRPPDRSTGRALVGDELDRKTLKDIVAKLPGDASGHELSATDLGPTSLCGKTPEYQSVWAIGHQQAQRIKKRLGACALPAPPTPDAGQLARAAGILPYTRASEVATSDYGGTRPVETLELARTLVTSSRIGDELVGNLLDAVFDNLYRFQIAYLPALTLDPGRDPARLFQDFLSAPLHHEAWRVYSRRGWLPEPMYVVLGAFRSQRDATLLATLLRKKFRDTFSDAKPLQIRRTDTGYFAVVVDDWVTREAGGAILEDLSRSRVPTSRAYLASALSDWGGDILEQRSEPGGPPIEPILYIHVDGDAEQETAESYARKLKSVLQAQGATISIPDIDRVGAKRTPRDSQLRYFKQADRTSAQAVLAALQKTGLGDVRLRYIKGYEGAKLSPQHLELWFAKGHPR